MIDSITSRVESNIAVDKMAATSHGKVAAFGGQPGSREGGAMVHEIQPDGRAWQTSARAASVLLSIHEHAKDTRSEHTRDILLQYIELLQDGPDQALRVLVHDEDLPSPRRVHRPDRLQELCRS